MAKRKGPSLTEELEAKRRQMEEERRKMESAKGGPSDAVEDEDDPDAPAMFRGARAGFVVRG